MVSNAQPDLRALASLASRLCEPGATFGRMSELRGSGTQDDPYQLPFWQPSDLYKEFFETTYEHGWVLPNFDWSSWIVTPEARGLISDKSALATATVDQLRQLVTAIMRQERFCEGIIGSNFENGTLHAIAKRADDILRSS